MEKMLWWNGLKIISTNKLISFIYLNKEGIRNYANSRYSFKDHRYKRCQYILWWFINKFFFRALFKKGFDKKRGLYFPKCDSLEVLEYYKYHYPINYLHIKGMITLLCDFNDISFSVFAMLHELGHWHIYKKL